MKKTKLTIYLSIFLAVTTLAGITAYAASNYGTSSDPLITLSYLNEVLTPKLLAGFQAELDKAVEEIGGDRGNFKVVTLTDGQTLRGSAGCEILLRSGSAKATASESPALTDMTAGAAVNSGASVTVNHLCMVNAEGGGVTATAASVKLMVRGSFTVG